MLAVWKYTSRLDKYIYGGKRGMLGLTSVYQNVVQTQWTYLYVVSHLFYVSICHLFILFLLIHIVLTFNTKRSSSCLIMLVVLGSPNIQFFMHGRACGLVLYSVQTLKWSSFEAYPFRILAYAMYWDVCLPIYRYCAFVMATDDTAEA
jgi:hypothetical protein